MKRDTGKALLAGACTQPPDFHQLHFMILLQLVSMLCCKAYCSSACNLCLPASSFFTVAEAAMMVCLTKKVNNTRWLVPCRVVEARQTTSIRTTSQLVSLIGGSRKSKQGAGKQIHPATRVFQVVSACSVAVCTAYLKLTTMVNKRGQSSSCAVDCHLCLKSIFLLASSAP